MYVNTAVILAGGKSKRMGRDKWSLPWKGSTLLEYLFKEMIQYFDRVLISTHEEIDIPFQQVVDIVDAGSLGGIYTLLVQTGEPVFFVAVDMPFMTGEIARRIADFFSPEVDIVVPYVNGRYESLSAVYSPSVISVLKEQILNGNFRIRDLFKKVNTKILTEEILKEYFSDLSFLKNINTPEEWEELI